jgi:hypothetical protein
LHNEKIKDFGNERSGLEESRYARIISSEVIFTHIEDVKTGFWLMPSRTSKCPKFHKLRFLQKCTPRGLKHVQNKFESNLRWSCKKWVWAK